MNSLPDVSPQWSWEYTTADVPCDLSEDEFEEWFSREIELVKMVMRYKATECGIDPDSEISHKLRKVERGWDVYFVVRGTINE